MKKLLLFSLLHAVSYFGLAAEIKYPVKDIPEELKSKMYAVIREKEIRHVINAKNNSTYYYRQVITVLNAKAKNYAIVNVGYDKMSVIKTLKAIVYNEFGVEVKKFKQSDFEDESSYDGFSLYSENRLKTSNLGLAVYPYTLEIEYEIQNKYLYSLPDFFLYGDDEISAQHILFSVSYPIGLRPRFKTFKAQDPAIVKAENGMEVMKWTFKNVIPDKFEPLSSDLNKIIPSIAVSPVDFEYGGYAGRMDTWKDYGLWQLQLNKDRNDVPESTRKQIKERTRNASSTEEKVKIVYEFLQNKTRYVNIVEGIGGLQPFPASSVDEVGYGDCKALSNYTVSLLAEVGIKAYYTKIRAGENEPDLKLDFPGHQTNHIIVAVPNEKDTLWLECTSQTNPFGYLGSFTGDRHALMITEQGGKIVKTPSYSGAQNLQIRFAEVIIEKTGNAKAAVRTTYSGLQYETGNLDVVLNNGFDDQKKWIQSNTQIPTFDVGSFTVSNRRDKVPSAVVKANLILNRLATVSGKRLFLTPNLMNRSTYVPEKLEQRKTSVVKRMAYTDVDTIYYKLPEEIYPEFIPEPFNLKSRFGEYESSFKIDQGSLIYIRKIKMNKGEFPPESYNELIEFYKNINKADHVKMVFMNKT
jgi:transglutaminase-like putative cysteine protease